MTRGAGKPAVVHVVAGAVTDAHGRILIAQRPPGKSLAGGWEFPGGKLEPGETRAEGLARELDEELGIEIRHPRPLMRVRHSYSHIEVLIDLWVVSCYGGIPRGLDGQALRWCSQDELAAADLLAADRPLIRALRLPERLTAASCADYAIVERCGIGAGAAGDSIRDGRALRGAYCASAQDAVHAAARVDFIVLTEEIGDRELSALCAAVPLPIFARGLALKSAWSLGATGTNALAAAGRQGSTRVNSGAAGCR